MFRLREKGLKNPQSSKIGDLLVTVNVEIPKDLTARQKKLLEEFDALSSEGNNPEISKFMQRMKSFFTRKK